METENMVPATEFCTHHNIELSFIYSLQDYGLIRIININQKIFVPIDQLQLLEKMVRLHYEMDINLEGIQTITYLLEKVNQMQQQILSLNNLTTKYQTINI